MHLTANWLSIQSLSRALLYPLHIPSFHRRNLVRRRRAPIRQQISGLDDLIDQRTVEAFAWAAGGGSPNRRLAFAMGEHNRASCRAVGIYRGLTGPKAITSSVLLSGEAGLPRPADRIPECAIIRATLWLQIDRAEAFDECALIAGNHGTAPCLG